MTRNERLTKHMDQALHYRDTLPKEVVKRLIVLTHEVCDIGDKFRLPPRQMATAVSAILASMVFVEVGDDVNANEQIDDFLEFVTDAMNVAVAAMRIQRGWKPPGES